jgi:GT2 family glycosyltransferase
MRIEFSGAGIKLDYTKSEQRMGLTSLRNASLKHASGEVVLFLDDDVILDESYVDSILEVYETRQNVLGVQGYWEQHSDSPLILALKIVFSIASRDSTACPVLPSMENVYPRVARGLTRCQWMQGNNMSYRREVFSRFRFNTDLKRPPSAEDAEFSFRVFCANKDTLFLNPDARLVHEVAPNQRPNWRIRTRRESVYRTYSFFNFRRVKGSGVKLSAFLVNRVGWLILHAAALVSGRGILPRHEHAKAILELSSSYAYTLLHLPDIYRRDLSFFSSYA